MTFIYIMRQDLVPFWLWQTHSLRQPSCWSLAHTWNSPQILDYWCRFPPCAPTHHTSETQLLFLAQKNVLLCPVVIHVFVHDFILHVEFLLVIVEVVQLFLQSGNVGLQPGLNVRGGDSLFLKKFPLGFQHFVLLFQRSDLWYKEEVQTKPKIFFKEAFWDLDFLQSTQT